MLKKILIVIFLLFLAFIAVASVVALYGYHYYSRDLATFEGYTPPAASIVYAEDGTPAGEFYLSGERRYPVSLAEIPLFVRQAFLAAEDASFYTHPGIDPMGILRAAISNFKTGHTKQGGSTITQQVVKNLFLTNEKSIERKIKEAILAYRIEKKLNKDQILEIYLNQIKVILVKLVK